MTLTPDTRLIVTPMDPQPDWEFIHHGELPQTFIDTFSPHAVGDLIPVREEWAQESNGRIFYKSDSDPETGECPYENDGAGGWGGGVGTTFINDWQPASTMPDFAVRHWLRVAKVEAKRFTTELPDSVFHALNFWGGAHEELSEMLYHEPYCWLTHVEPKEDAK